MANELYRHKKSDMVKWVLTLLVGLALIAAVVALFVKLDRQTSTTTIGGEAYSVGTIDAETGEYVEGDTAIYLRKAITTDGLKCELADDAKIKYQLFFYNADDEFISASEELTSDWNGEVPEGAESVKVMITPTEDEDGKVSLVEVLGYADQLTVTVNK